MFFHSQFAAGAGDEGAGPFIETDLHDGATGQAEFSRGTMGLMNVEIVFEQMVKLLFPGGADTFESGRIEADAIDPKSGFPEEFVLHVIS